MESLSKKELKEHYKNRSVVGGVYCIKCNGNGRTWLKSTKDLEGQKNRFQFFVSTNTCPEPSMLADWKQYGANSFSIVILEELKKGDTQSDREFADDISVLLDMWLEKQQQEV